MLSRIVSGVMLVVTCIVVSACANTIRGVGRDMHQTGQAVEDAARGR
jgi:predicted small secreted protein